MEEWLWIVLGIVTIVVLVIVSYFYKPAIAPPISVGGVVQLVNDPAAIWSLTNYDSTKCTPYQFLFQSTTPNNIINDPIVVYQTSYNSDILGAQVNNPQIAFIGSQAGTLSDNQYLYGPYIISTTVALTCNQPTCVDYKGNIITNGTIYTGYVRCTNSQSYNSDQPTAFIDLHGGATNNNDPTIQSFSQLLGGKASFVSVTGNFISTGPDVGFIDYYGDYPNSSGVQDPLSTNRYLLSVSGADLIAVNLSNPGISLNSLGILFYVIRGNLDGAIWTASETGGAIRIVTFATSSSGVTTPQYVGFRQTSDITSEATVVLVSDESAPITWQLIPSYGLAALQLAQGKSQGFDCTGTLITQYSFQKFAMPTPAGTQPLQFYTDYSSFANSHQNYFYMATGTTNSIVIRALESSTKLTIGWNKSTVAPTTCEFNADVPMQFYSQIIDHEDLQRYQGIITVATVPTFMSWNPFVS